MTGRRVELRDGTAVKAIRRSDNPTHSAGPGVDLGPVALIDCLPLARDSNTTQRHSRPARNHFTGNHHCPNSCQERAGRRYTGADAMTADHTSVQRTPNPEEAQAMESWRLTFRDGFAPVMSTAALTALAEALHSDSRELVQGATTTPPPLICVHDWPVETADAIGYAGWKGDRLKTVGEVERYFANSCWEADQRLGEPAACRWFLNWYDDTPRDEMRRELLAEVRAALDSRAATESN